MNVMRNTPLSGIVRRPTLDLAEIEIEMGEMLASAIRHGALLDERWWSAWMRAVQDALRENTISIVDELLAVEMYAPEVEAEGLHPHRRWYADPMTKVLIVGWWKAGHQLPDGTTPIQCLARHWRRTETETRFALPQIIENYRSIWQTQLPGLLLAFAVGPDKPNPLVKGTLQYDRAPAASAPQETWERIIHGCDIPDRPREPKARAPQLFPDRSRRAGESELFAHLENAHSPYEKGVSKTTSSKARARHALGKLQLSTDPVVEAMRLWCSYALRYEKGHKSTGYSASTVRRYLEALMWAFSEWLEVDPAEAGGREITGHLMQMLQRTSANERKALISAIASFERYRDLKHPVTRPRVPLQEFREGDRASPDLVLPEVYGRAKKRLERDGQHDLALALVLQYRGGLRPEEAFGLRVGDVCFDDARVELIVEANEERDLKTKTSRRIVPLDVLLEQDERDLLLSRVASRLGGNHDPEAWLFGDALAVTPTMSGDADTTIDEALCAAGGSDQLRQRHLRHSFASYLLATLMLPQDVDTPSVPASLASVISPDRRTRVADRLLGGQRLGASSLHAVSQVMGHTGTDMTLKFYVHLLDLCLGLCCSRPSSLFELPMWWLVDQLEVSAGAFDKAAIRQKIDEVELATTRDRYKKPSAAGMRAATPRIRNRQRDSKVLEAQFQRQSRDLRRVLSSEILEVVAPQRRLELAAADPAARLRKAKLGNTAMVPPGVPLRRLCASIAGTSSRFVDPADATRWQRNVEHLMPAGQSLPELEAVLPTSTLKRFVEARLKLSRSMTAAERSALLVVVGRWREGREDIKLPQLGTAQAFVRLAKKMGFKEAEIRLSLTSVRANNAPSDQAHAFLKDTGTIPDLAGPKWRGSVVVRFRPTGLDTPLLASRACRFALLVLAIHSC